MATPHQLRCFLATLDTGSFTAAAAALGYAQPSVSEQVRRLEDSLGVALFARVGRGVVPTDAAGAVRPHAEHVLHSLDAARRAARAVRDVVEGTVRFGMFGTSRVYFGADVVAALLAAHPGIRIALVGQNSTEVADALRAGRIEAGLVAAPVDDEGLELTPILRDELVYVTADARRAARAVDAHALADAPLVLSEASWGDEDPTRGQLARAVQAVGGSLRPRVEVEDVETAVEVAGLGLADAIVARGVLHRLGDRLPQGLQTAPLDPPLFDTFSIAHRRGATLSRAAAVVVQVVRDQLTALDRAIQGG